MPGGRAQIYENRVRRTFALDGRNDKFLKVYAKEKGVDSISRILNRLLSGLRKRWEEKTGKKIKSRPVEKPAEAPTKARKPAERVKQEQPLKRKKKAA